MPNYKFYDSSDEDQVDYVYLNGNETVNEIRVAIYEKAKSYIDAKHGEGEDFVLYIYCDGQQIFNEVEDDAETFKISEYKDRELVFVYLMDIVNPDDIVELE